MTAADFIHHHMDDDAYERASDQIRIAVGWTLAGMVDLNEVDFDATSELGEEIVCGILVVLWPSILAATGAQP